MIQCKSCGQTTTGNGDFCSRCGSQHSGTRKVVDYGAPETARQGDPFATRMICPRCNVEGGAQSRYCNRCGGELKEAGTNSPPPPPPPPISSLEVLRNGRALQTVEIEDEVVVGRDQYCQLTLSGDPFVSPEHARFFYGRRSGQLEVEDLDSLNGVYLRVRGTRPLWDQDLFRLGNHFFRLERVERTPEEMRDTTRIENVTDGTQVLGTSGDRISARLTVRLNTGEKGKEYSIGSKAIVIGCEGGTHNFVSDKQLSPKHALIRVMGDGSYKIQDLNSRTGTWVRLTSGTTILDDNSELLIGQHRIRVRVPPDSPLI